MRFFLLILFVFLVDNVVSQELIVKSFVEKPTDLSASTNVRNDINGTPCALVKVQIALQGVLFYGNIIGDVENKTNEYWVYMTTGSKRLQVKHEKYLPLDIEFSEYGIDKLGGKESYVLRIASVQSGLETNKDEKRSYKKEGKNKDEEIVENSLIPIKSDYENFPNMINSSETKSDNSIVFNVNGVAFNMIYVNGSTFEMGATKEQIGESKGDEKPKHIVTLTNFYIGETEVTQELWQAVMGSNPSSFNDDIKRPVVDVSYIDCMNFVSKLNIATGKRFDLPTEAQWEYAARGGNKSTNKDIYCGGNNIMNVAWFFGNSKMKPHPVKTKAPNELGLYDMSGNAYEWCLDWYGKYEADSQTNPCGVENGEERVYRGGSYRGHAGYCRTSYRGHALPAEKSNNVGLRLVLLP